MAFAKNIRSIVRSLNPFRRPEPFEEATDSEFSSLHYHPTSPGTTINDRFLVVGKLGRGVLSSIWLARNLSTPDRRFVVLKIPCLQDARPVNEWEISKKLQRAIDQAYEGQLDDVDLSIRVAQEKVQVRAAIPESRPHEVLEYEPTGASINNMKRALWGQRLPRNVVGNICGQVLEALTFLHEEAGIIHGDLHPGNVLCRLKNIAVSCGHFEAAEKANPSRSKKRYGMMLNESRVMEYELNGDVVLTDFGCGVEISRINELSTADLLPDMMRAPEIILEVQADEKLDIWCLGLMVWYLYSGQHLIDYQPRGRQRTQLTHVAWLMSILGEPTPDEVAWLRTGRFFPSCNTDDGDFPHNQVLEHAAYMSLEEAEVLHAVCEVEQEQEEFLKFMRRMLRWRPEDRSSARELLDDPWLKNSSVVVDAQG